MPSFLAHALFAPLTQRVLLRLRPAYQPLWALRHTVVAERVSLRTFATFGEALRPCLTRCITAALRAVAFVPNHRRFTRSLPVTGSAASSKSKVVYRCSSCGEVAGQWKGRCPSCDGWNTCAPRPAHAAPSSGAAAKRQSWRPDNALSFSAPGASAP